MDHVGGVPQLAERIPIGTFVDHGRSVETGKEADDLFHAYVQVRDRASHLIVRAGDRIPIEGIEVRVVSRCRPGNSAAAARERVNRILFARPRNLVRLILPKMPSQLAC